MKPIEQLSDEELSTAIAVEVWGWSLMDFCGVGHWETASGTYIHDAASYSPPTDKARALAAFDEAVKIVAADITELRYDRTMKVIGKDGLVSMGYYFAKIRLGDRRVIFVDQSGMTCSLAASRCALAAVRAWREKKESE